MRRLFVIEFLQVYIFDTEYKKRIYITTSCNDF